MPYADPERQRAYLAARHQATKHDPARKRARRKVERNRRNRRRQERPFRGFDCEGGTRAGRHELYLVRLGRDYLRTGRPLDTETILRWLWSHHDPNTIPVGFFINYDTTMILRDLPEAKLDELYHGDSNRPTFWRNFALTVQPGRFLRIRFAPSREERLPSMTISDVGGLFQCSFVAALEQWEVGSPGQIARIAADKARRHTFDGKIGPTELAYNALEVELLEQLMERVRGATFDAGLRPRTWQGAGQIAAAALTAHDVPKRKAWSYAAPSVAHKAAGREEAAVAAYYGGRFETAVVGNVGEAWEVDLASAYPAAMAEGLPCPIHWRWEHRARTGAAAQLQTVRWRIDDGSRWGPFPHRDRWGGICCPIEGIGTYWSCEVEAAARNFGTLQLDVLDTHSILSSCDCDPFGFVPELYEQRLRLGKSAAGRVLKLALNSLYGKCAQSVGARTWTNAVWAGLITARTRARLLDVFGYHEPEAVIMFATDAVYLSEPPRVPTTTGKALGGWESQHHPDLFVVRPGIYFGGDVVKSRGVSARVLAGRLDDFRSAWRRHGWDATVTLQIPNYFVGMREALHRGKPELAGSWLAVERSASFDPKPKRARGPIVGGAGYSSTLVPVELTSCVYDPMATPAEMLVEFPEHPDGSVLSWDLLLPRWEL